MKIIDFELSQRSEAIQIAMDNYEVERRYVSELPKVEHLPDLSYFTENNLGVAAFEGNTMLGFLCTYRPTANAFRTTNVKGTFSPIHAHGVVSKEILTERGIESRYNRERIYSLLYEAAANKWVKEGVLSHSIGVYSHDTEAVNSFFYNGFGLRCIDAIRSLKDALTITEMKLLQNIDIDFCEVPREEWKLLLNYHNALISHLGESPSFMKYDLDNEDELYEKSGEDVRYFAAKAEGSYIAYIKVGNEGENFVTLNKEMMNICGAYCDPEFRGTGIYHNLLCYLMKVLRTEGYLLLGVDCESFNPTARGFWLKYFTPYTYGLVRRIDDNAIIK